MTLTNFLLFANLATLGYIALMVYAIGEKMSEYDKKEK